MKRAVKFLLLIGNIGAIAWMGYIYFVMMKPYEVTDMNGHCLFIAEPWDTFPNGEPIGIECDMYYIEELGAPMFKTEFDQKFGNKNFN